MKPTLVSLYRLDIAGLPFKEAQQRRAWWFSGAKRWLNLRAITSDPVADYPIDRHMDGSSSRVVPYAAFWDQFDTDSLVELYRVTKKLRPS